MAIKNSVVVLLRVVGDGSSTVFNFDLLTDSYSFDSDGYRNIPQNWFANSPQATQPTGVDPNTGGSYTFTMSGTVVTATFSTAPANGFAQWIEAAILF
jgi:hypothetical protein